LGALAAQFFHACPDHRKVVSSAGAGALALYPCTNCGMAPMDRPLAISKLVALNAGAALARGRFG